MLWLKSASLLPRIIVEDSLILISKTLIGTLTLIMLFEIFILL